MNPAKDQRVSNVLLHDPSDRIVAATALHHGGSLVTCDQALQAVKGLKIIW
jgi:PIN domain nuclease of toxin-antitoxin system